MVNKFFEIIQSILEFFFNRKKKEKLEVINKIEEKQKEVDFKSEIEKIASNVESKDAEIRKKALEDMRKLIAE